MLVEGYKNFRLSGLSFHLPAGLQGQNFCLGNDFRVLEKMQFSIFTSCHAEAFCRADPAVPLTWDGF